MLPGLLWKMFCRLRGTRLITVLVALLAVALLPGSSKSGMSIEAAEPPITGLAFAPDGQSVVVASQAGVVVRSWPALEKTAEIATGLVSIHDLAFSPGGQYLAIAGGTPAEDGQVEICQWPGGQLLYSCRGHEDTILAVAWKNDVEFATGSLDREIVVWDAKTQSPKHRLRGHSDGVTSLCFLQKENVLVSAGLDQNLRLWNPDDETSIGSLNNHKNAIHQIASRPNSDGPSMVASVSDDRTVRLWQPALGRMVRFVELSSAPLAVSWLRDGSRIVLVCADGQVRLIDPDNAEISQELPGINGWAYSLAVHPGGDGLLVGGSGGSLVRIAPEALQPQPATDR